MRRRKSKNVSSDFVSAAHKNETHVVGLLLTLLSTTTEAEDQVKRGFLLDVVIVEGAAILELLSSKDQALLIRGDALSSV